MRVLPPRVQVRAGAGRAHECAPTRTCQDARSSWRGGAEARGSCPGRRLGAATLRGAGGVRGAVPNSELQCCWSGAHSHRGRAALDAPGAGAREPVPRREGRRGGRQQGGRPGAAPVVSVTENHGDMFLVIFVMCDFLYAHFNYFSPNNVIRSSKWHSLERNVLQRNYGKEKAMKSEVTQHKRRKGD
jgi:hypothetical protein